MTNKPLTQRQAEALEFIKSFVANKRYPPTVREIADHMHYSSSSTVFELLGQLVKKGFISKGEGPRTIQVIDKNDIPGSRDRSSREDVLRMKAALRNILDICTDDFARYQARYGLGINEEGSNEGYERTRTL
ncbi:LexA family protein [Paenibacillus woosongensis]|uniref:LexA repressor DNA-binding domain-containing protein n=1 Tax=Paenibacillus woosongensis TaxID=307580 RepID=A0A7X3CMS9_9BACL|nr:hypothetical protein [Paenibacillus woosongensis]MUG45505.1 hypothetical protein [Paenibacillus woosongensis]